MRWVIALLIFLFAAQAQAATYWVSATGGTTGNCSTAVGSGDPGIYIRTIPTALACIGTGAGAGAGQTVIVHAGTYTAALTEESLGVFMPSGTSGNYFTLKAAGSSATGAGSGPDGELVTIRAASGNYNFQIDNPRAYWIVQGLTFDGTNLSNSNVRIGSSSGSTQFVHNAVINSASENGVYLSNISNILFAHNSIHDGRFFTSSNSQGANHCLYTHASDSIFEYNDLYNCGDYGIHQYNGTGSGINNNIYRFNKIHDWARYAGGSGMLLTDGSNNSAYANILYATSSPFATYGISSKGSNSKIYNNSIYNVTGQAMEDQASGTIWRNNIAFTSVGTSSGFAGSGMTTDHNYCYSGCPAGNTNSTSSPFTNAGAQDFTLHTTPNGAINTGLDLGAGYSNIAYPGNVTRPAGAWDIGAYEFQGTAAPVIAITSPTSNSTYTTVNNASTVSLGGTTTQVGGTISYACADSRCTAGNAAIVGANWTTSSIALKAGNNVITVTATDGGGVSSAPATIIVTYIPAYPGDTLAGAWGLEEQSGSSAQDSSGHPTSVASLVSTPTWNPVGKYGYGVTLNGINQYLNVPDANSLDFTQGFTLSIWVKPAGVPPAGYQSAIVKNGNTGEGGDPFRLYVSQDGSFCTSGGPAAAVRVNGESGPQYTACWPTPLTIGVWNHLAATYDGANLNLYVNGVLRATTMATGYIEPSAGALQIGNSRYNEFFNGVIDEPRVRNYAIPVTAGSNTVWGAACALSGGVQTNIATPSIYGDANCAIVPSTPLGTPSKFEIGASSTFSIGASSTFQIGAQ